MAEENNSHILDYFFILLLVFLAMFFVIEALMASCGAKFGHTTGIIVLFGILISFIIKEIVEGHSEDKSLLQDLQFEEKVFFDLILPLIIFPSGFNMRRKKFFANIGTIMKFGFVGTIICFCYYTGLLLAVSHFELLRKPDGDNGTVPVEVGAFEIISICSLLCSSDVIAAISMINYKDQPKLFSIVYGEGVFNDIVSIIMFRTVQSLQDDQFEATTPFKIIWQFIILAVASLLIGLTAGVLSSLMFKYLRFLCHSAITETILLLIIAMITYYVSESFDFSGIISLLSCGIAMAHYTWYNLSPQGKTISSVTFSIFGSIAESLVFAYIGLCVFTYTKGEGVEDDDYYYWSVSFIGWMTLIVIFGRIAAVFTAHGLFYYCKKKKDVSLRELCFISYGGMIRGAIAFGLVLQIPISDKFKERGVIVTTTLALVIITTVVFGSFMPVVQAILVPPPPVEEEDEDENEEENQEKGRLTDLPFHTKSQISHMSQVVPIPEETNDQQTESQDNAKNSGERKKEQKNQDQRTTHYENLIHPNDERSEDPKTQRLIQKKKEQEERRQKRIQDGEAFESTDGDFEEEEIEKGCAYYFNELDKKILKPLLVYRYDKEKMERHDQVNDFLLSYANVLGSVISAEHEEQEEFAYEEGSYGGPSQFQSQSIASKALRGNTDLVSTSQHLYRLSKQSKGMRNSSKRTGAFNSGQSASSFGDQRSQVTYKASNSSLPTHQMLRASRRKRTQRVNSLYNRYGFGNNSQIEEAIIAMRGAPPPQGDNSMKVRKSTASIAQTEQSYTYMGSAHGRMSSSQNKRGVRSNNKLGRGKNQGYQKYANKSKSGSVIDISDNTSDADMYMSGLSRPDQMTAEFRSRNEQPSFDGKSKSVNMSKDNPSNENDNK